MSQNHRERKQDVLVNVILDKSGSMASKTNDVIEGFNAYIAGLGKEDQANYLFSLTLLILRLPIATWRFRYLR